MSMVPEDEVITERETTLPCMFCGGPLRLPVSIYQQHVVDEDPMQLRVTFSPQTIRHECPGVKR